MVGFVVPGIATAGLAFLTGSSSRIQRSIGGILIQCTLEEQHTDRLQLTEHPVESNANVTDHAFKMPMEVVIRCGWSNSPTIDVDNILQIPAAIIQGLAATAAAFTGPSSPVQTTYNQLLAMQASRQPIKIFTGKRNYENMEIVTLSVITDHTSENALMVVATCREVILVSTKTVQLDPKKVADPSANTGVEQQGTQSLNPAPQSSLNGGGSIRAVQSGAGS